MAILKSVILTLILFLPFIGYSQDLIILRNGEQIDCKITKVDSSIVYYDFLKGERKLSSYVDKSELRSYKINAADVMPGDPIDKTATFKENTVVIDTTKYVKETNLWVNLITYSQRFGAHAKGWSVQYYGYNLRSTAKWAIPIVFSIEGFEISTDYFSKSNYQSVSMSYLSAGISPFYKINDYFFLNLGASLLFGDEELTDFSGKEISHTFFGLSPTQGIYFISKSKVGITLGLNVYEKVLSSKVYKNDVGIKLEFGVKF